jgi:hypothetical protein
MSEYWNIIPKLIYIRLDITYIANSDRIAIATITRKKNRTNINRTNINIKKKKRKQSGVISDATKFWYITYDGTGVEIITLSYVPWINIINQTKKIFIPPIMYVKSETYFWVKCINWQNYCKLKKKKYLHIYIYIDIDIYIYIYHIYT